MTLITFALDLQFALSEKFKFLKSIINLYLLEYMLDNVPSKLRACARANFAKPLRTKLKFAAHKKSKTGERICKRALKLQIEN